MDFHYTVTTNKTIDDAVSSLEQSLKKHKFGILWQLDVPAKLKEKGVDSYTNPYRRLEVCNPSDAARVLNHQELVGYFLPCKITVYESEGKTKIGLPRPTTLVKMLDDSKLLAIADEIEAILIQAINECK